MQLKQKLMELAPRYNMPDIIFPSFERKYGFLTTISSSDLVYSMTALLDCGSNFTKNQGLGNYENLLGNSGEYHLMSQKEKGEMIDNGEAGTVGSGAGTRTIPGAIIAEIASDLKSLELDDRKDWTKHFYLAYDSLKKYSIFKLVLESFNMELFYQFIINDY
jgi:hypothetical protein